MRGCTCVCVYTSCQQNRNPSVAVYYTNRTLCQVKLQAERQSPGGLQARAGTGPPFCQSPLLPGPVSPGAGELQRGHRQPAERSGPTLKASFLDTD